MKNEHLRAELQKIYDTVAELLEVVCDTNDNKDLSK